MTPRRDNDPHYRGAIQIPFHFAGFGRICAAKEKRGPSHSVHRSILALDLDRRYSESEINEALRPWSEKYGGSFGLDHVTLRRFLIDEKYLVRDLAGPAYVLNTSEPPTSYDEAIKELDLDSLFDEARRSREERKRKYTQSADR